MVKSRPQCRNMGGQYFLPCMYIYLFIWNWSSVFLCVNIYLKVHIYNHLEENQSFLVLHFIYLVIRLLIEIRRLVRTLSYCFPIHFQSIQNQLSPASPHLHLSFNLWKINKWSSSLLLSSQTLLYFKYIFKRETKKRKTYFLTITLKMWTIYSHIYCQKPQFQPIRLPWFMFWH